MRRNKLRLDATRRPAPGLAVLAIFALVLASMSGMAMIAAAPAVAADNGATISLQLAPTTADSGKPVTGTLTVACSVPGGCTGTTVSFPTNSVSGNGTRNDFSSWLSAGTCPSLSKANGQASFAFGTIPTGSSQCAFTLNPPQFLMFNNALTTITPSISGSNFATVTGAAVAATTTAGHNAKADQNAVSSVGSGGTFSFNVGFFCGTPGNLYSGDIGTSALTITNKLPANFTYTGYTLGAAGLPGTVSYDPGTNTLTYSDPTGKTCQSGQYFNGYNGGNEIFISVNGTASTAGVPNTVGTQICNTANTSFTYIDGVVGSSTSPTTCVTVTSPVPSNFFAKSGYATTMPNFGQFKFSSTDSTNYAYTYPGDWDQTGTSVGFRLSLRASSVNSGVTFSVADPLPCLDNYSSNVYSSAPAGTVCKNPAFIPTVVQPPSGFTATSTDRITLVYTDGTTGTVPFVAGTGWTVPTTPKVAEIDFPQMPGQAQNTTDVNGQMYFQVWGYSAASSVPGSLLTNTAQSSAYRASDGAKLAGPSSQKGSVLVLDSTSPSNALVRPNINAYNASSGACTFNIGWDTYGSTRNAVEVPNGPSKAIYFDYLAPQDGTLTSSLTQQFAIQKVHNGGVQQANVGAGTTTAGLTATTTANYQGTGRTLYSWVIPAGSIAAPGNYTVMPTNFAVKLVSGCSGVYQNDLTVGYGATVKACLYGGLSQAQIQSVPSYTYPYLGSGQLTSNSVGTSNWCGISSPITFAAVNPGFSIAKTVQGNLDAGSGTGPGHVSPAGGTAIYSLQMVNTGQSNLTNPVMYDLLPRIGDTLATSTASRGSQFPVQLTAVAALPANVTVSYSTAANPCRPEVLASNNGCVSDWSSTPPANLATTTALRFTYNGTLYVSGAGPSTFSASFSGTTPAVAAGQAAINGVGANATAGTSLLSPAQSSPVRLEAQTGLTIAKSTTSTAYAKPGDLIPVTFTVKNVTAVQLSGVGVVDALTDAGAGATPPAVNCVLLTGPASACSGTTTTLLAGQTATFTAAYAVTQADVDHGQVSDVGTTSGTPAVGSKLTATSNPVSVPVAAAPAMTLKKTSSSVVTKMGDPIAYTFVVTNTGNQTLSNISVLEGTFTGSGAAPTVSCPSGTTLAPTTSMTCTGSYATTQADIDAGSVANTATASANAPSRATVSSGPSTVTTSITATPALGVQKSADVTSAGYIAGQQVTYSIVVTNTGNVTISNVQATDSDFTGSGTLGPISPNSGVTLAPGGFQVFTATYTLTQADVDRGSTRNTANASGTAPDGATVTPDAPSTVVLPAPPNPSLTVVKSVAPARVSKAGDPITYSFELTNTGNVTLSGVGALEDTFTGTGTPPTVDCPSAAASLLPGAVVSCTATYEVTQADVNAGMVTNSATGTATAPNGATVVSEPSTASVTVAADPRLSVLKTVTPAKASQAGDELTYTFTLTNTGNVTLTKATITEGAFTGSGQLSALTCPATLTIGPAEDITCTASYTLTQQDVDSGSISNTASATATPPGGGLVAADPSTATATIAANAELSLSKTADAAALAVAGQNITYSFAVANTGNVTIVGIAVQDTDFSGSGSLSSPVCSASSVAPGKTVTCTASYTVSQADIDNGTLVNTATVSGTTDKGEQTISDPSTVRVPVVAAPALRVVKSADVTSDADYTVGKVVTYSFVATNTGNVTMTDVDIVDQSFTGTGALSPIDCPAGSADSVAPGAQVICSATYTLTQQDIDAGQVTNTAVATGTPPAWTGSGQVTSTPSTATLPTPADPSMTVVKTSDTAALEQSGQQIAFLFAITNTGNVTLTNPVITDSDFSGSGDLSEVVCPDEASSLLPGQNAVCAATYTVTQADIDSGALRNTATVSGTTPAGGSSGPSEPTTVIIPTNVHGAIVITKTADHASVTGAGQKIVYSFTVSNTGNTTIQNLEISDRDFSGTGTLSAISCPDAASVFSPSTSVVCTAAYSTTSADVASGFVVNSALVTGQPDGGGSPVTSDMSTVRVLVAASPTKGGLALTGVTVGYAGFVAVGLLIAGAILYIVRRRRA